MHQTLTLGFARLVVFLGLASGLLWNQSSSLYAAAGSLVLKRELRISQGRDFHPTRSDYNGDRIDDLLLRVVDAVELRSGLDGKLLAVYQGEPSPYQSFGW